MNNKKLFLAAAAAMLLSANASAQKDDWYSYSYIEAQGGLQMTATNAPMDKLITPTAALSFGHYFTPVVGARLHVNAWQSKSGFSSTDQYYKWKYVTPDLDLMLNLSNLFGKSNNHLVNVILLGGVGLNYAWDNDELKDLSLPPTATPLAWDDNRLSHNLRAGLRFETNQSKPLGLSLEVNANSLDDRFNSKTNDKDDWMFTAMLGLSYRFGHKAQKDMKSERYISQNYSDGQKYTNASQRYNTAGGLFVDGDGFEEVEIEEEVPEIVKVKERKPITKTEPVKLHKEVFYAICVSENESPSVVLEQVANFMKENKDCKIMVVGYADKGTGNARLNQMYAKRRADTFKKDLVSRFGIDASRIITDSKGDTVQPFAENDKNRCVIVDGEAVRTINTFEEVEVEKTVMKKVKRKVRKPVEQQ